MMEKYLILLNGDFNIDTQSILPLTTGLIFTAINDMFTVSYIF